MALNLLSRLKNVKDVLAIAVNPFSKDTIVSSSSNKVVKAATEFIANNPYTTAGIAAAGVSGTIKTAITSLSTKAKVVLGAATLATAPAIISSPTTAASALKVASGLTPEKIVKLSSDVGKTVETPTLSNLKDLVTTNKTLLLAGGAAALIVGATKIAPAISNVSNIVATNANTKALTESAKAAQTSISPVANAAPVTTLPVDTGVSKPLATNPVPQEPTPSPITAKTKTTTTKKRRKKSKCSSVAAKSIKRMNLNFSVHGLAQHC